MPARRRRPAKQSAARQEPVQRPDLEEAASVCYFCSGGIAPHDRIRRFHELTVHERCYSREIQR